ncbi:MAG: hypothetical protein M1836_007132 [Candelina mexicana]|nr:MAG: hypothetical protein M1836_007132 [Candelina mexicana]
MSPTKRSKFGSPMASLPKSGRTRSSSASMADAQYPHFDSGSSGGGKKIQKDTQHTKPSSDPRQSPASSEGSCKQQDSSSKDGDGDGEGDGDGSAEADGTDNDDPESFAPSRATYRNQDGRQGAPAASNFHRIGASPRRAGRCDKTEQQHGMGRTSRLSAQVSAASATKRSFCKIDRSSDDHDHGSEVAVRDGQAIGRRQRRRAKSIRDHINAEDLDDGKRVGPTDAHGKAEQLREDNTVLSEDDEYGGVDLISDSDPDDPNLDANVERLEEQNIIGENEEEAFFAGLPRLTTTGSEWDDHLLTDGLFLNDVPFFAEQIGRGEEILDEEVELFRAAFNRPSPSEASSSRRVRWQDEIRSASTSTVNSDEDSAFPDLFVEQERYLDVIGNEPSDGEMSYWDLEESNDSWFVDGETAQGEQDSQSDQEMSTDYQTDEGETTDEDESLTALKKCARNEAHRRSTSSSVLDVPHSSYELTTPSASRKKGPSMVSWAADPTKPYAVINSTGRRIVVYPPLSTRKACGTVIEQSSGSDSAVMNTSPRTSFASMADDDRSETSNDDYNSPLDPMTRILFEGTLNSELGNGYLRSSSMQNPSHALYHLGLQTDREAITQFSNDDGEGNLNLKDFIDFGEDSSDCGENLNADDVFESPITPTNPALQPSPLAIDTGSSRPETSQSMLSHFDLRGVAAFRRNQVRHSNFLSRPQHLAMAHNAPFVSKGAIKGGRFAAAQTPLSPIRKRRPSKSGGLSGKQMLTPKYKVTNTRHNRSRSAL